SSPSICSTLSLHDALPIFFFGSNQLGVFPLTPQQQASLQLSTNRFVAVLVEPVRMGTNQVLSWRLDDNPEHAQRAQTLGISLIKDRKSTRLNSSHEWISYA